MTCPKCNAERTSVVKTVNDAVVVRHHRCPKCGSRWKSDQRLRKGSVITGSLVATGEPQVATNSQSIYSSPVSLIPSSPDPKSNLSGKSRARVERIPEKFEAFWELYPRKKARKAALRTWVARELDQQADAIMAALQLQRPDFLATMESDPRMVPHPATWLNGERWKDEVDRRPVPRGRPARSDGNVETLDDWLMRKAQ